MILREECANPHDPTVGFWSVRFRPFPGPGFAPLPMMVPRKGQQLEAKERKTWSCTPRKKPQCLNPKENRKLPMVLQGSHIEKTPRIWRRNCMFDAWKKLTKILPNGGESV